VPLASGYGMIYKVNTMCPSGHHLSTRQFIVAMPLVAPPLLLILLVRPCLLMRHLHIPPPVCLSFALAGSCIASPCATFATHPLDEQPPLNLPAGCSNAFCCPTSAAYPLGVLLPLNAPPPSPTPICLLSALAGGGITSCCTTFATCPC
jgi:hypothetical protein